MFLCRQQGIQLVDRLLLPVVPGVRVQFARRAHVGVAEQALHGLEVTAGIADHQSGERVAAIVDVQLPQAGLLQERVPVAVPQVTVAGQCNIDVSGQEKPTTSG